MRQWLWKDVVDCSGHYEYKYMPIYAVLCVVCIFVVCVIIDIVRIYVIETPLLKVVDDKFLRNIPRFW